MEGKDAEGLPFAFLKSVEFKAGAQVVGKVNFSEGKPFQFLVPDRARKTVVTLEFHSHYGEPSLDIPINITPGRGGWSKPVTNHTLFPLYNPLIIILLLL